MHSTKDKRSNDTRTVSPIRAGSRSGGPEGRPWHVVAADGPEDEAIIVVTVHEPDPARWEAGFTRRKTP